MTQMNLSTKQKQTQREDELVGAREPAGEGWARSLGSTADTNYYMQDG